MIAYITGASSGIGKALAEKLLELNHQVIGLSRHQTINHPNYEHINIDLADIKQVESFSFPANLKDDILLVNNAGSIGPIKPIGHQIAKEIIEINHLNLIAPQILCNQFIHQYQSNSEPKYTIINISSGAGKKAIDAWATYCASKAALDLFSETVFQELKTRNHLNWKIYAIAPGVVDTEMQSVIRSANPKAFFRHQDFIDLKINNELTSTSEVANQLSEIINGHYNDLPVVFSLRDFR